MGNLFCDKRKTSSLNIKLNNQDLQNIQKSTIICKLLSNQFLNLNWEEMKSQFVIDEEYGCSFDFSQVSLDPYYNPWLEFVLQLPDLIEKQHVEIKALPMMKLDKLQSEKEKIIIYSLLCYITNAYLFNDQKNIPQILPINIAQPFYLIAQQLGVKPAMGWAQCLCNWKVKDPHQSYFDSENLLQRYTLTKDDNERTFFLVANIADFRMAKVIKSGHSTNQFLLSFLLHNLNQLDLSLIQLFLEFFINQQKLPTSDSIDLIFQLEEESLRQIKPLKKILLNNESSIIRKIIENFKIMAQEMDQITLSLKKVYEKTNPEYFFRILVPLLQGYARKEAFPNGLMFEGIEVTPHVDGGSGGNSPSFQIYERFLGLRVDNELEKLQEGMRRGMISKHKDLIKFLERNSLFRLYAQLTDNIDVKNAYNLAVNAYIQFNEKHHYFLPYYVEKQMQQLVPGIDGNEIRAANEVPYRVVKLRHIHFQKFLIPAK